MSPDYDVLAGKDREIASLRAQIEALKKERDELYERAANQLGIARSCQPPERTGDR